LPSRYAAFSRIPVTTPTKIHSTITGTLYPKIRHGSLTRSRSRRQSSGLLHNSDIPLAAGESLYEENRRASAERAAKDPQIIQNALKTGYFVGGTDSFKVPNRVPEHVTKTGKNEDDQKHEYRHP